MNILFFTPCLTPSAIGRVSALVVAELQRQGHAIAVVRSEDPALFDHPVHDFGVELIDWNQPDRIRAKALTSNLVIYQVGDNFSYHRGCMEWMPELPGLVSLHDNFLGHLFWSCAELMGRPRAKQLLTRLYDETVAHRFFDHADSSSFINYASEVAPMTEWIAAMATGVIVHSTWAVSRIAAACHGPVEVVPLPYDAPFLEAAPENAQRPAADKTSMSILTIGHVNPNKRHASVIEAIGSSERLRERVNFRIVGSISPEMTRTLKTQASALGVRVAITGEVDGKTLAAEIHAADLMCCLRWPALEAASASTIEAMLYGKPAIVTDTGFYRDLPDDCVIKIAPQEEIAALRSALEQLVDAPAARIALGERARGYAAATFRADHYAERIIAMKSRIEQTGIIADAAKVFSSILARWGGKGQPALISPIAAPLSVFR
ncbi:glycosyltransferase family 4 protein [Azoarcus sp. KH32C]|uniref:glycosyltransferase family 4 protein n=1 Tax=Azoarcus sp. KH32C TaxID=748247 RepID=UPI00023866AC|nr:glycosyltransferase family 4 protein [Azoarcus sp. KH32C]BAL22589.1 glycosyltransferase family protein [Azoarcus sp. KH32C]